MTLEQFNKRYSFDKDKDYLGQVDFGKVYKVYYNSKKRYVVLKIFVVDAKHKFSLQREVQLANELDVHTNIAKYQECYRFDLSPVTLDYGLYYKPIGEKPENLEIMYLMDKHLLVEPTAGVLTMQSMLANKDIKASYERVRHLMRKANIRPIYPMRQLTVLVKKKYAHPYLLKDLKIDRPNQVW